MLPSVAAQHNARFPPVAEIGIPAAALPPIGPRLDLSVRGRAETIAGQYVEAARRLPMLRRVLCAAALAMFASPALADPDKDESGKGYRDWDRRYEDRYTGNRRDDRDGQRYHSGRRIPAGHLPPPGECRVWFPDRPAGHQPPPMSCREAYRFVDRHGGRIRRY